MAMIILLLATSSILVTLDENGADKKFELSIRKDGRDFAGPITLSRKSPPFFCLGLHRLGTLEFQLNKPVGYARETRKLGLGSAIRVGVPDDFRAKELYILRLVPGWGIVEGLQEAEPQKTSRYALWIQFEKGKRFKVPLWKQPIYIGASAQELEAAEKKEAVEWWKRLPRTIGGGSEKEAQDSLLEALYVSTPLYISTDELVPGEAVKVDLEFTDTGAAPAIHTVASYTVSLDSSSIQTIFLQDR